MFGEQYPNAEFSWHDFQSRRESAGGTSALYQIKIALLADLSGYFVSGRMALIPCSHLSVAIE